MLSAPVAHHVVDGGQQFKVQLLFAMPDLHEKAVELVFFLLAQRILGHLPLQYHTLILHLHLFLDFVRLLRCAMSFLLTLALLIDSGL